MLHVIHMNKMLSFNNNYLIFCEKCKIAIVVIYI